MLAQIELFIYYKYKLNPMGHAANSIPAERVNSYFRNLNIEMTPQLILCLEVNCQLVFTFLGKDLQMVELNNSFLSLWLKL